MARAVRRTEEEVEELTTGAGMPWNPILGTNTGQPVLPSWNPPPVVELGTAPPPPNPIPGTPYPPVVEMGPSPGPPPGGGTQPTPPTNTVLPAISGGTVVGNLLTCTNGTWTPTGGTYARQWISGAAPIPGATAATYTLQASDVDNIVNCDVTYTSGGSTTVSSNALGPITATAVAAAEGTDDEEADEAPRKPPPRRR